MALRYTVELLKDYNHSPSSWQSLKDTQWYKMKPSLKPQARIEKLFSAIISLPTILEQNHMPWNSLHLGINLPLQHPEPCSRSDCSLQGMRVRLQVWCCSKSQDYTIMPLSSHEVLRSRGCRVITSWGSGGVVLGLWGDSASRLHIAIWKS